MLAPAVLRAALGTCGRMPGIVMADLAFRWVGWSPPPLGEQPDWLRLSLMGTAVAVGLAVWVAIVRKRKLMSDEEILRILR